MKHSTFFESNLIGNIYQASYDSEHWPVVLQGVAELTKSDSATIVYQDAELHQASVMHSYNIKPEDLKIYNQTGQEPHFELFANVPLGEATSAQKIVPDRQKLEAIYGEEYIKNVISLNMYYIGGVWLFNDKIRKIGVGLQRGQESGHWSDEELQKLTDLSPHIQRAMHIHREFTRLRVREQALCAGLNKLLVGLILFDSTMQPIYINPIAESILKYHPAIHFKNNRIYASKHEDSNKIRNALILSLNAHNQANPWEFSTALGIRHSSSQLPLPIMISPLYGVSTRIENVGLDTQAAMLISDPEKNQPIVPEALCSAYHLTAAESRVAIAIANGLSIKEIAIMHGNKTSTIQSQLKAIKAKLGISRISELIKVLLIGPFRVNF